MVTGRYYSTRLCRVFIDGVPLRVGPSLKYMRWSYYGFRWGFPSDGASQLSFALLLYFCGEQDAMKYYQMFSSDVIYYLPINRKEETVLLFDNDIRNFVRRKKMIRNNKWGKLYWKLFDRFHFTPDFYEIYIKPNVRYEDWWSLRPSIYFAIRGKLAREGW